MSVKLGIGMTAGSFILLLLTMGIGGYILTQSEQAIKRIESAQSDFITKWEKRIEISNKFNNQTRQSFLQAENDRDTLVDNIMGNLTSHRLITNATFDHIEQILNATTGITSDQYDKLADEKVNNIVKWVVGNLTKNSDGNLFGDVIGDPSKGEDQ